MPRRIPTFPPPPPASSNLRNTPDPLSIVAVPACKAANLLQLRRAKGQIVGIERMIQDDRICADIIVQVTAARASLQVVAKDLLAQRLKACHIASTNNGGAGAEEMYQDLADLVSRMAK